MIPLTQFHNQQVAVLGSGLTGQSLADAVHAGGGYATLYDDKPAADKNIFPPQTGLAIDALLLSPGVPLTHAMVRDAQARNVPVFNDCEVFYRAIAQSTPVQPCFITITGTNGKSTTTALIGHLLKASGHTTAVGGNIGVPVLNLPPPAEIPPAPLCTQVPYVIEMSSYQAEGTTHFTPNIAVFLNLTPDHLERHGTMDNYYACKTAPLRRMNSHHTAIIAIDDAYGQQLAQELTTQGVRVKTISAYGHTADYTTQNGLIYEHGAFIANMQPHEHLQGQHNLQNTLAAVAAARAFGGSLTDIVRALPDFVGLPHRLQPAGTWQHIRFINDSKATNAESSVHALRACRNIYWILGGLAKAGGLQSLTPQDIAHVNRAYLIGAASAVFAEQLTTLGIRHQQCHTLDNAVQHAARNAQHDTAPAVVLLSPACASQDQFKDYQQRGTHFMELVQAWQKTPPTLC